MRTSAARWGTILALATLVVDAWSPRQALYSIFTSGLHQGADRHIKHSRHRIPGVRLQEGILQGGRPCAACGGLGEESSGSFNNCGIFYCVECSAEREVKRQQRQTFENSRGLGAAEDPASRESAAVFMYDKAEAALRDNDMASFRSCLTLLPEICARRGAGRRSLLHVAATQGRVEMCRLLLDTFAATYGRHVELAQALELYEDAFSITAGECAFVNGHQEIFDMLVQAACERPRPSNFATGANMDYVNQKLQYSDDGDVLFDANGAGVMMGWEEPLMKKHAEALAPIPDQAVLNVGFGLGLVDGFLQDQRPRMHTIVEAHPDVHEEMCKRGWDRKKGVNICRGRWQDVIEEAIALGPYDGVYFDTYAEAYGNMQEFYALLPRLLRPGGRFAFFNGLSDNNIYAQAISCKVAQIDLANVGLACMYEPIRIGDVGDANWRKVVNTYWSLETYYAPIAVLLPASNEDQHLSIFNGERRGTAVQLGDAVGKSLDQKLELAKNAAAAEGWIA